MSGGHEPNPVTLRLSQSGESVQGNFWEQVGGRPTFEKLVRAFYDGIRTDEVLLPMYPEADVPVVQLSLDRSLTPQQHLALAKSLAPLRDEGVLVIGSGDIVHNLRVDFRQPAPLPWAIAFNEKAKALITAGDAEALADYEALGPEAVASINSAEHYLPLLYVLALRGESDKVGFFNDDVFAALSMTSVMLGDISKAA